MAEILGNKFKVVSIYQTAKPTEDKTFDNVDRPILVSTSGMKDSCLRSFNDKDLKEFGALMPNALELRTNDFDFIYQCPSYDRL